MFKLRLIDVQKLQRKFFYIHAFFSVRQFRCCSKEKVYLKVCIIGLPLIKKQFLITQTTFLRQLVTCPLQPLPLFVLPYTSVPSARPLNLANNQY